MIFIACGFPKQPFKLHSVSETENLCRSKFSVGSVDLVSAGHPGCGNDPEMIIWIAYEGSLPADSGHSGSIPDGWCVLENYRYKQQYRLLETVGNDNLVMLPPAHDAGNPDQTQKHFKTIPHENGHVKILNAAADQILDMKFDPVGDNYINQVRANSPKNSIESKCLFTFKEVDDGPGEVTSILAISTQLIYHVV